MARKCIAKLMNQKTKTVFALVNDGDETFSVLRLCENYDGKVRGGIARTWRTVASKVDKIAARDCFYKKIGPQNSTVAG